MEKTPIIENSQNQDKSFDKNYSCFYYLKEILIIDTILKCILVFSFGFYDITLYPYCLDLMKAGINPYSDISYPNVFYNFYPAFFFDLQFLWYIIFGDTVFSVRLLLFLSDYGCIFGFFFIGKLLHNEKIGTIYAWVYVLFPLRFFELMEGKMDFVALFFQIVGIYYYLREKHFTSSIFLGFGIFFRMFPIFCLIPMFIGFLKKRKFNIIAIYCIGIIFDFFIVSLPFLIWAPWDYLSMVLLNSSRHGGGLNYTFFFDFFNFKQSFEFCGIKISFSILFLFEIAGLIILVLLFLKQSLIKERFFSQNFVLYLVLIILMVRMDLNSWLWVTPFFIPEFFSNEEKIKDLSVKRTVPLIFFYICIAIISVALNASIFDKIFEPFVYRGDSHYTSIFFERIPEGRAFGVYYYLFLILSGTILFLCFYRQKNAILLSLFTYFHAFDSFLYYLFEKVINFYHLYYLRLIIYIFRNLLILLLIYISYHKPRV